MNPKNKCLDWRDLSIEQRNIAAERLLSLKDIGEALKSVQFSAHSLAVIVSWYCDAIAEKIRTEPTSPSALRSIEFLMKWAQNNTGIIERMGPQTPALLHELMGDIRIDPTAE